MIKLDEYESQMVWLAKGWVGEIWDGENYSPEVALKNLWSNRSGIDVKYVRYNNIADFLIMLLYKVLPRFDIVDFFNKLAPNSYMWKRYADNKGYYLRACQVALFNYLAILQTRDSGKTLVQLEKLNMDLFISDKDTRY